MSSIRPSGVLAPLRNSPKLVCLARTFPKHAEELGNAVPTEPIFFLKSGSSVVGPNQPIRLPKDIGTVHHEGEIAVVLSASLSGASHTEVESAIAGYTVLNDVTAREVQTFEKGRFSRAKSYDTFCPMRDSLLSAVDWKRMSVLCVVNGETRQDGRLTEMFMTPHRLIAWVSHHLTLNAGDVVSLGTPPGVNTLVEGDTVETILCVDSEPILRLQNSVEGVNSI